MPRRSAAGNDAKGIHEGREVTQSELMLCGPSCPSWMCLRRKPNDAPEYAHLLLVMGNTPISIEQQSHETK